MTSNKAVSDKQIEKELEDDWVERHISEAPNVLREFLGGDGLSLEGKSVVDIGCGDGLIDWGIATSQNPARLVGVDLERTDANDLIRRLRGHGLDAWRLPPSLSFTDCIPGQLPFSDGEFDWAISWSAFEHIHDPVSTIREVRRILKPGGSFFIQLYPFFWSEHGPHLENWYPEGFPQRYTLDELASRVSPSFARGRSIKVGAVRHSRHGNRQPGDEVMWEYLNLNRISLDDLHRALLQGGFWVAKAQLISPAIHLPMDLNARSLTEQLVAGVHLIANTSPIPVQRPQGSPSAEADGADGSARS